VRYGTHTYTHIYIYIYVVRRQRVNYVIIRVSEIKVFNSVNISRGINVAKQT
jgi:hypothetical protein